MVPKKVHLRITNGPSRWEMMLAVFDGQTVTFSFEPLGEKFNQCKYRIIGGHFYDQERTEFHFSTMFHHDPDKNDCGGTGVQGMINFKTRKGYIDVSHLVELGLFPAS